MENRTIQITPTIIGVVVPSNAYDINIYHAKNNDISTLCFAQKIEILPCSFKNFDGNWKLHGICTLPELEFGFEVDESWVDYYKKFIDKRYKDYLDNSFVLNFTKEDSFRTRIQKAIQDEGLLIVNPYDIKGQTFSNEHQNKWQSAESKTVKGKILIIEKI